jgi:S1-C subfamily serine protease
VKHLARAFSSVVFPLTLLVVGGLAAQTKQPEPSLKDTLGWMRDTIGANGNLHIAGEVRSVRLTDFSECRVHFTYTTTKDGREPYLMDYSFNLADIDPAYVTFFRFPKGHPRQGFGLFSARTQNNAEKIKSHQGSMDLTLSGIVFDLNADYGVRFTKAFKDAVDLCDGTSSITASEPNVPRSDAVVVAPFAPHPMQPAASQSAPSRKDIPAIAKSADGAIVTIVMANGDKPIAQGTGFLVRADGVIVTNYHVIENGDVAAVKFPDGSTYPVDGLLAGDKVRDLAVIKIHGRAFRTLTLGNSDRVRVGEQVVAIGNPLSLESTVSNGIISGVRTSKAQGGKFLQTTAPISPGSSGGPLFNMLGEVVGINTMYLEGGENLNFAIPVNDAKLLLLSQSARIRDLPNETEPVKAQAEDHEVLSSARDYYQQLRDAGGFPERGLSYACFADGAHSDEFFTFQAFAYDENYSKAADEAMELGDVTKIQKQMEITQAIQTKAPYVNFMLNPAFKALPSDAQEFSRSGGRILFSNLYTKGVKDISTEYRWNENEGAWLTGLVPVDPKAAVKTFVTLKLTIEPTTMRYLISMKGMTSTGSGETKATRTEILGPPSGGVCEKIAKPKAK